MVNFLGTETVPSSGSSSPTTMRKSVVLPAPLGPTRPAFSPGFSWKEASTKISCLPYCLLILEKEINLQASTWGFSGWIPNPSEVEREAVERRFRSDGG